MTIKLIFRLLLGIFLYIYIGYGILLYLLLLFKKPTKRNKKENKEKYEPNVTLFVAAYNEEDYVVSKVENSRNLDYPKNKIRNLWVTDGSNDRTTELLKKYPEIEILHENERNGKIGAINRGMPFVDTPIVIFSDGNTILSSNTIREIVKAFEDPKVGCVTGEKKIRLNDKDPAATAGEGIYWKYESILKKLDAKLNTTIGAVGELFAIRTELFEEVEKDTILDDFMISMRIAMRGYKIQYTPKAYAIETASENISEELKRKIRISAGALQSTLRLIPLLNPFKFGLMAFQYISHKVLRWFLPPFLMPVLLLLNIYIAICYPENIYLILLFLQLLFYLFALIGFLFETKKIKLKFIFVPYYICMINFAVVLGILRFMKGKQSVKWERAKRSNLK